MQGDSEIGLRSDLDEMAVKGSALQLAYLESSKLERFFGKFLGEALHLEADSISFTLGEPVQGCIIKGKTEVKSLSLKRAWFEPMCAWLIDRYSVFLDQPSQESRPRLGTDGALDFVAVCRLSEQLVSFHVKRTSKTAGKTVLTLSDFSVLLASKGLEHMGLDGDSKKKVQAMFQAKCGIIVLGAPDPENLYRSKASLVSISGLCVAGDLADEKNYAEIVQIAKKNLVFVTVKSDDAVEALLKLKESNFPVRETEVIGIIVQGFARMVCENCGREAIIDTQLISQLPDGLRPPPNSTYRVGRGCGSCKHKGYKGLIGVQSIIKVEKEILATLMSGIDHAGLVQMLYARGTKPLLEDGVRKALMGHITFESLYEVTKFMPPAYIKLVRERAPLVTEVAPKIELPDDFLRAPAGLPANKPLSGKSAFTANPSESTDDSPLFKLGPSGKIREKPLLLVVEDDPDQQSILQMVLKSAKYDVLLAKDGEDGLKQLANALPDLIISDLMMPNMDGSEFVRRLKSHEAYRSIPVLVLTVVSDAEKEYNLLDLGADDYCEKTIQRKILLKRIQNLLKRTAK